jgi:CRISPR-associated protein Cmr3
MKSLELEPLDTLFFRDARPMTAGAGSGGHGANWPLPPTVHAALRCELLRRGGEWKAERSETGHHRYSRQDKGQLINDPFIFTKAYRSLRCRGPLPVKQGQQLYLPRPRDLICDGDGYGLLRPARRDDGTGHSNLPPGLTPVVADGRPGKEAPPEWIPLDAFLSCLRGKAPDKLEDVRLFDRENRVGIELDDEQGAAKEGQLYTSEHLRLRPDVRLWLQAELHNHDRDGGTRTLDDLLNSTVLLGGESRRARVEESKRRLDIPPPSGRLIKWVLVSHAVFAGGWRPGWIDPATLKVRLRAPLDRKLGENRKDWRERMMKESPEIGAALVAVCAGKPVHFSGWDAGIEKDGRVTGGPRPTLQAVPAGAVYYFKCENDGQASALVIALHDATLSDYLGEKGLGWGFCGTWKPGDVGGRPGD